MNTLKHVLPAPVNNPKVEVRSDFKASKSLAYLLVTDDGYIFKAHKHGSSSNNTWEWISIGDSVSRYGDVVYSLTDIVRRAVKDPRVVGVWEYNVSEISKVFSAAIRTSKEWYMNRNDVYAEVSADIHLVTAKILELGTLLNLKDDEATYASRRLKDYLNRRQ